MIANKVIWRNEALDDPDVPLPVVPLAELLEATTHEEVVKMFPTMAVEPFPTL
jgi:hypothetical protein